MRPLKWLVSSAKFALVVSFDGSVFVGGIVIREASTEVARVVVVGVLRKVGVVFRNDGHDGMIGRLV